MTEEPPARLRLVWSRTWDDVPHDFKCCTPAGEPVGRIFYDRDWVGRRGGLEWQWACYGRQGHTIMTGRGHVATKDQAAQAVEDHWFSALERIVDT